MAAPVIESHAIGVGDPSATVSKPSGTTEGDLLVAIVGYNTGFNEHPSAPPGWVHFSSSSNPFQYFRLYYKFASESEASSYSFVANQFCRIVACVLRVSGADPVNPINATAGAAGLIAPSVTTTVSDALVVRAVSKNQADFGLDSPLAGHTEIFRQTFGGSNFTSAAYVTQMHPGATGTAEFDAISFGVQVSHTIAIAPGSQPSVPRITWANRATVVIQPRIV